MLNDTKTNSAVFGVGAKLVTPRQQRRDNKLGVSGVELMKEINDGDRVKESSEFLHKSKTEISRNLDELIEVGARIRPLIVDRKQVGWVRGLHVSERKILSRWIWDSNDYLAAVIQACTSFSKEEVASLSSVEVRRLAELISQMTERDLSLLPFLSAFVTTSLSENLWFSKGTLLTSYEDKILKFPDGHTMRLLAPPDHAKLWATLCNYREESKRRLDANFNALLVVQVWAGKAAEPLRAELRAAQRGMLLDSMTPWETAIKVVKEETELDNGWGHAMDDDSPEGLLREIKGMFAHDKHEQFMDKFYRQQQEEAEARKHEIEQIVAKRGGPGIRTESIEIMTEQQVRERERALKKGMPRPPVAAEREVIEAPEDKIQRYR